MTVLNSIFCLSIFAYGYRFSYKKKKVRAKNVRVDRMAIIIQVTKVYNAQK